MIYISRIFLIDPLSLIISAKNSCAHTLCLIPCFLSKAKYILPLTQSLAATQNEFSVRVSISDETEISFANTEMNQAPIVTLNSSFYKTVLIESKVIVEFKIEDPEGKELEYQDFFSVIVVGFLGLFLVGEMFDIVSQYYMLKIYFILWIVIFNIAIELVNKYINEKNIECLL